MAPYEWWCPRCRVTHPPGRRICLHCNGRVQPTRDAGPDAPAGLAARLGLPPPAGEEPELAGDEAPESGRVRGARLGMTLAWVVLAILATLMRLCQGQPG